jgi:hypothetical protein
MVVKRKTCKKTVNKSRKSRGKWEEGKSFQLTDKQLDKIGRKAKKEGISVKDAVEIYGDDYLKKKKK